MYNSGISLVDKMSIKASISTKTQLMTPTHKRQFNLDAYLTQSDPYIYTTSFNQGQLNGCLCLHPPSTIIPVTRSGHTPHC